VQCQCLVQLVHDVSLKVQTSPNHQEKVCGHSTVHQPVGDRLCDRGNDSHPCARQCSGVTISTNHV